MKKLIKFIFFEIIVFIVTTGISFVEINQFDFFQTVFEFIKTPASWFVGLSLSYAFSNVLQKFLFSIFSKKLGHEGQKDFFFGFLLTLVFASLLSPYIKELFVFFFSNFFIYFHIILLQSLLILYFFFKLKNDYEISGKYFVVNELIILLNTIIIIAFVA